MMVESIACVEWIQRNVFDVERSNIGSKSIGKHLNRQKGEGVEPRIYTTLKSCNDSGTGETSKN